MNRVDNLRTLHYPDEEIELDLLPESNNLGATGSLGLWYHYVWNMRLKFLEYRQWWYRDPPKAKGVSTFVITPTGLSATRIKIQHRKDWEPQILGWMTMMTNGSNHLRNATTTGTSGYTYGSKVICENPGGCTFSWLSFYPF